MMTRSRLLLTTALAAMLSPTALRGQSDPRREALMAVVGLDLNSAEIVSYCESGAPAVGPRLRTEWQSWRERYQVEVLIGEFDDAMLRKTRDAMAPVVAATRRRLGSGGQPATVCAQLASMWTKPEFDLRQSYPAAFDATDDTPAPRTASGSSAPVVAPSGTVYTVAQLTPLVAGWFGTPRNYQRASAKVREVGTLYIRGTVIVRGDRRFLATTDSTFTSQLTVSPGIDLAAFDGQEITVEGTLDEVPSSIVWLKSTRVVRDASGLRPSPLAAESGLRRLSVSTDRITALAGRGLRAEEIQGLLYSGYGVTGVNGYEFREEMRLLLRDGWAYLRDDIAPTDLDVEVSRRIEPQQWARWRSVSGGYEIQGQDDHGAPDGEWSRKTGRLLSGWPPDQRLSGSYTASAFYGSVALGGTYSKTTFVFRPDGRWERIGFSRSSSGSMAAQQPVGFSSSASSASDGSGTKSNAGGGNANVYARSQSRRDDGAAHRGTYRLDGWMIEMRADDGTVSRTLCVPADPKFESIYLFGQSFSRK